MLNETAPKIGDNQPPTALPAPEELHAKLEIDHLALEKRRDELIAAEERMPEITSDELSAKASDYMKQVSAAIKAGEAARVGAKEPYLEGGRVVDGFFKKITDPLSALKARLTKAQTAFLREKEARERRARIEAEQKAREEAEAAKREAEEAAKKLESDDDLVDAIDAEQRANTAAADLVKANQESTAKAAELSRVRGDFGSLSSLRTHWTFCDLDRDKIDLEKLRQHLPSDGLERAVRGFIRAGGRKLDGVKIYEDTTAQTR